MISTINKQKCSNIRFVYRAVVKELIETEEEFGKDIQLVVERYLKPLDNPGVPRIVRDNKEVIFTNLKQIADFHNTYVFTAAYTDRKMQRCTATLSDEHSQIHYTIPDTLLFSLIDFY